MVTFAQIVFSLVLLYFGGEKLVRGASTLAARAGVSPLAVGLTVVAFGTSAPELAVSVDAALSGQGDIALGNVVGSNIANIALILGLAALLRPAVVEAKIVRLDAPIMIGVSLLLVALLADGGLGRAEGALLLAGLAVYTWFTFWQSRRETARVQQEFEAGQPAALPAAGRAVLSVGIGLLLLMGGGRLLVTAAVALAQSMQIDEATIGLTIVAVGTSLPELATSLVAASRGQGDIAVGNVVGSNIFNILCILGITTVLEPVALGGITPTDLGTMTALACLVTVFLWTRLRLGRVEGAILLGSFVAYTAMLIGR